MALQVFAHRRAKRILAEPFLEHAQHRRAFLIRDAVERVLDVAVIVDRLADLARRQQAVAAHRVARGIQPFQFALILRPQRDGFLALRPRRERLVEPDVVPPRHGDEIAEPLMRHFMRSDVERGAKRIGRRVIVGAQQCVAEGDQTRVFHRARAEIRRAEQIELVPRIRDVGVFLEVRDDVRRSAAGSTSTAAPFRADRCRATAADSCARCSAGIGAESTTSHGPTAHATRYVGSGLVVLYVTVFHLPSADFSSCFGNVLAITASSAGTVSVMSNGVLKRGSSNPGNALRALIASICVIAYASLSTFTL